MKTLLFSISITALFFLSLQKKTTERKRNEPMVSAAYIDSVMEADRIERMKIKFNASTRK